MSGHPSLDASPPEPVALESGLEALQSGTEFDGPVEAFDGHQCNDHFAQIYETEDERFATAVPFVRHGLERDERVTYVVDESDEDEVQAVLRDAGIDVDAALDSGALSFHTVQDTYLRNGSFDPDEMVEFYGDTVAAATEAYEALRIVAETTWLQDEATTVEQFMEYEAKVNDLLADEDCLALCQYDRDAFPPEVVRNVVRTHPHLIYDGAVCHNFYYTPPAEFFSDDEPAREVDRMLGTLRERTEAKTDLADHERFLRELYQITASQDRSFEEKIHALLDLGCEQFGLGVGGLNRVDLAADEFEVEYLSGDHELFEPGAEFPLSDTYCQAATDIREAATVTDPVEEGFDDLLVYEDFGVDGYLGTYVPVDGGPDRTLAFVPDESYEEPPSEQDKAYLELMGQWVGYELNRRQREQFLRECYEITSDPALDFEGKLHRLLDLARERMSLDAAGLTHLPEWDGKFLTEYAIGYGADDDGVVDASDDVWVDPGEGCYCRQAITADEPVGMADVRGTEWEDDEIHREHGLTCYLGTKVTSGSTPYGTLWVGSTEPRDREFSETERTFLELMGQWVSYELERRDHTDAQRKLYEVTSDPDRSFDEKLDALFDLGCEQFGLELGGLAKVDPEADQFEVEETSGEHEYLVPGEKYPLSETYCQLAAADGETAAVTDPVDAGFEGKLCYDQFGVESYLGTHLDVDGDVDRTFFFVSNEPRDDPITDSEQTFNHLMGQWVQYELERRQRERELRERTEHLSALVETTPECIKTVAPDGTLLQMNPAGLDMVEAESDPDVVGECVYDLIAPEHREEFREFNERVCRGERGTLEFDIVGLEGTRRHMESHAAPLQRPDGTTAHVALTRDVTDRRERERELERALDLLEKTERIADVGGWEIGVDTEDVFWTDHIFDLLEVDADEEPPLEEALDMYHEEDKPIVEDAIENALDSGDPFDVEVRIRTNGGETQWLRLQGVPETDDDEVVSFRGAAQDITERKQNQRKLEEQNERLESFASMLAHELRNPVTIGQIYSQQLPGEVNPEAVDHVTEAFDRIEDMIDVMLVLTRGREAVGEPSSVELADVAREAWDDIDASDATLDVEVDRTIEAEETYARHMIRNLLENAVEHGSTSNRPEDDDAVEHGGSDVTVTVDDLPGGGFYVADDGPGIPAEQRDAIFDQGYTTAADSGGTGLGLAFVQKLAEVYEWDCTVTESASGGARFEFRVA